MRPTQWTAALLLLSAPLCAQPPAMNGFNLPCWDRHCYSSAGPSMAGIHQAEASWVALTPSWYMKGIADNTVFRSDLTPTDDSLRQAIAAAKGQGLQVALKPHVDVLSDEGRFRAAIDPKDARAWFESYRDMIRHYARLAAEKHVDLFVVGTELAHLDGPEYLDEWKKVVAVVHEAYPGVPLTYAANWYKFNAASEVLPIKRVESVGLWALPEISVIGVDCYAPAFGNKTTYKATWLAGFDDLRYAAWRYRKKVLFTEFGISSRQGANRKPSEWADKGGVDLDVQKNYFQSFLEVFGDADWFAGLWVWNWEMDPGATGSADKGFSVQGKPALEVLKSYFAWSKRPAPPPRPSVFSGENVKRALRDAVIVTSGLAP